MTTLTLDTRPEPLDIDPAMAAVVVVDMQNAFASCRGLLDPRGRGHQRRRRRGAHDRRHPRRGAGAPGVPVVYLQTGYKPDLSNGGGPASPNPRKETALCLMRARPELKGRLLVEGTWDFQIVDALAPRAGDVVVLKTRYSGFAGTELDSLLRVRGIRYLVFVGIATNVCVESTLRDAYFHEYWPILVTDGHNAGRPARGARGDHIQRGVILRLDAGLAHADRCIGAKLIDASAPR